MSKKGLIDRLKDGETLVVAEGYLFEFEARGYLQAGGFVPEVVIEHPDLVRNLHREFVHAGSDVVLAFTYYGHREKMRLVGREDDLERINRNALRIAREVADETGTLMAGNICNSTIYKEDEATKQQLKGYMEEQIKLAVEEGADFIVAETYSFFGEALLALEAIKKFGNGLPAVVTLVAIDDKDGKLFDGISFPEACRLLEEAGAAVVGLNCGRGPRTMIPILKEIRKVCKGPIAGLPVTYRTDERHPTFQTLRDIEGQDKNAFPLGLEAWLATREMITEFTKEAKDIGVQYLGLCCGNRSHYLREMAEAIGRTPPASRYAPNMKMHFSRSTQDRHSLAAGVYREIYNIKLDD